MADQPINGLPKKTAAADTDALLMIGASEEYQIDYGKLADAILNKLTNKTFALDQGSKSLVAALNELNSKTVECVYSNVITKPIPSTNYFAVEELKIGAEGTYIIYVRPIYSSDQPCGIKITANNATLSEVNETVEYNKVFLSFIYYYTLSTQMQIHARYLSATKSTRIKVEIFKLPKL